MPALNDCPWLNQKNRERPNHMVYYRSPYSQATIVGCTMCPILRHTRLPFESVGL